jgi:peptidoglycan/LPS O-acetylase OafA/YrhL
MSDRPEQHQPPDPTDRPALQDGRFAHIDTLRGVACLLVVYIHAVQWLLTHGDGMPTLEARLLQASVTVVDPGKVGVLVFFAISGFVVPASLLRSRAGATRAFIVNRAFRILPAYWLSLAIGAPIMVLLADYRVSPVGLLGNVALAPQLLDTGFVLPVYWSLQVELLFYGLCVGLFLLGWLGWSLLPGRVALGFLLGALLGALLRSSFGVPFPVGLLLFLSLMFWGFCARLYAERATPALRGQMCLLAGLYLVLLPLICYLAYAELPSRYGTWHAYALSYELAVLIFLLFGVLLPRAWAPLTWTGRISYSVYLLHVVCIATAGSVLTIVLPGSMPGAPVILAFVVVSLLAAAICYRLVEAPLIRVGRRLNRRLESGGFVWAPGDVADQGSVKARPRLAER